MFVKEIKVYHKKLRKIIYEEKVLYDEKGYLKQLPSTYLWEKRSDVNDLVIRTIPFEKEEVEEIIRKGRCPQYPNGRYSNLYKTLFKSYIN